MMSPIELKDFSSDSSFGEEEEAEEEVVESLGSQIVKKYNRSVFDRHDFLPEGCIEALITEESVAKELAITELRDNKKLLDFIVKKSPKIFAVLAVCNFKNDDLRKAVTNFGKHKLDDSHLPVTKPTEDRESEVPFFNTPRRPWDTSSIDDFCKKQWVFLAPVFSSKILNLQLHADHILPFINQDGDIKSGAFGEVHQVAVHEKHYTNPVLTFDGKRANVAIKEIKQVLTNDEQRQRELEAEWEREVKAHIDTDELHHPNVIEFIAAVTRGKRYLMFRWADGGNLREFWQTNRKPQLSVSLVKDIVTQLRGLADALEMLHSYGGVTSSYRHGDIKPENILRVRTRHVGMSEIDVGIFKIADMGLAKHHNVVTEFRPPTSMRYSTYRYEPPEVVTSTSTSGRSRRQDIWSFGCVTLELIIWLLYGADVLNQFNMEWVVGERIASGQKEQSPYFEIEGKGRSRTAKVHPSVDATMDALSRDQECRASEDTALKDLLRIVRKRLLVVNLGSVTTISKAGSLSPPNSPPNDATISIGSRAGARDLCLALDEIMEKAKKNESYWYSGKGRSHIQRLQIRILGASDTLSPPEDKAGNGRGIPLREKEHSTIPPPSEDLSFVVPPVPSITQARKNEYRNAKQIDIDKTEFPVDNKFAKGLVESIGINSLFPKKTKPTLLCGKCQKLDVFDPFFHIVDTWAYLEANLDLCDFCAMRFSVSQHLRAKNISPLRFDRTRSMLKLNESQLPVISICRSSSLQNTNDHLIQVGLPSLPAVASKTYFDILRQFVKDCDTHHTKCLPPPRHGLPTRLLDLGTKQSPTIRILETISMDSVNYIALSHPWGAASPEHPHFCTFPENIDEFKEYISFDKLPATFQHAVTTTRELGLRYLWIDSICIIQGPYGDFAQEATRMEYVFSSAYCVIAASSAKSQQDGFLNPRKDNDFLTVEKGGQSVYISRFMDDFNTHVLEGPLSKRGWVLQERALARRTIFFTDRQTYWECGNGVRCETLTKMENQLVSFLGDPNFPSKISRDNSDRGERIRLYENLYRQYSRLHFTQWYDRPIAIAGLEKRLIRDLNAQGGFGVFDDGRSLLQRSLLWRKGQEVSALRKITIPAERELLVPSWSWMGYEGAIDYLDVPLGEVEWELPDDEIRGPWAAGGLESWHTGDGKGLVALSATARSFEMGGSNEEEFSIFYDMAGPSKIKEKDLKCVVAGKMTMPAGFPADETTHYVLLIAPSRTDSREGEKIYERVGVGYMAGKYIDWVATGSVHIQ